jgi:hypothetical protein
MPYQMTPRRFANLDRKNASLHLVRYASYLASHGFLKPILQSKAQPEEVFDQCKQALFANWWREKKEAMLNQPKKVVAPSSRYVVKIFGKVNGKTEQLQSSHLRMLENGHSERVLEPMEYAARDYASAERLSDRRLFERSDAEYAEIANTSGKVITTKVERRDAVARILAKPKSAVMKAGKRSADLHWKPKSHATRSATRWSIAR